MATIRERLALGIDRGGTHTRLTLMNGAGAELRRAVLPSGSFRLLPRLVMRAAAAWKLGPEVPVVIATRGALTRKWKKPFLLGRLRGRLNLLDVISDAQAAYLAAHGDGFGALLIAGTGSVVFLKGRDGRFHRIGGRGHSSGDPGSGLWLGTRFLRTARPGRTGLDRRARASYARKAVEKAGAGDEAARALVRKAQEHLSDLLAAALKKRGAARTPLKVALTGGLMNDRSFRNEFTAMARRRLAPARVAFTFLKRPAERAAAELALKKYYGRNKNP